MLDDAIAIDTETTGLDLRHGCRPFMVTGATSDGDLSLWEWDVDPLTREPIIPKKDLAEICKAQAKKVVVFHNTKFDVRALDMATGAKVIKWDWDLIHDTLIASHVMASADSHKLKDLALQLLDIDDDDETDLQQAVNTARRIGKNKGWRTAQPLDPHFPAVKRFGKRNPAWKSDCWLPRAVAKADKYPQDHPWWSVCSIYALRDVERTMGLWMVYVEALLDEDLWEQYDTRRKLLPIVYDMENAGITYKATRLKKVAAKFGEDCRLAESSAFNLVNHCIDNLNSPKQIQGALYGHLGLKPTKETKTGWATDADTLTALEQSIPTTSKASHFITNLVKFRKLDRMDDYLWSYNANGVPMTVADWLTLHPSFNITGTATTRFSCHDPNAQNISKQEKYNLRQIFGPCPGRVWFADDYSNIEFRIFAWESGDKELIAAFEAGQSMHLVISEILHPKEFARLGPDEFKNTDLYGWVKNGNFALIYGASQAKANATYRVEGAYARIKKMLPKVDGFIRSKYDEGRSKGYITTLGGYRLTIPRGEPHKAANYFVQGSAGWAMVLGMIRVHEYLESIGPEYKIIMTIHDELVMDFPDRKGNVAKNRRICKLMEQSGETLSIPTPVHGDLIRDNWSNGIAI